MRHRDGISRWHFAARNKTAAFKAFIVLVVLIIPLTFGVLSLILGKDINWDLKNYHYYNAYAFLENRLGFDIVPAQLQTFYNPLLDIPFYLLARSFPAWVAGFVLGSIHGLNISLVLLIFWKITDRSSNGSRLLTGITLAAASAIAPGFLSELGNTMNDNIVSLFALFTVLILINASQKTMEGEQKTGLLLVGASGLVMGVCVGLKPTSAVFAAGSAIALPILMPTRRDRIKGLLTFGIAGLLGGLVSAGFWWWELWSRYGNPLMPYLNNIFRSPYASQVAFTDTRFVPREAWEYMFWPLIFSHDSYRVSELKFHDVRFALLYVLVVVWILTALLKFLKRGGGGTTRPDSSLFSARGGNFLLVFFLTSFVLWMMQSSYYRYIIALELLVPLCFLVVLGRITRSRRAQAVMAASALLLTLSLFMPYNWGRIGWGDRYFRVEAAIFDSSGSALVIMLGRSPMSYVIPEFPGNYRFVRPEGNLFMYRDQDGIVRDRGTEQQKFVRMIMELVDGHNGAIYVLYNRMEQTVQPADSLLQFGLSVETGDCFLLKLNTPDMLEMCRAARR